MPNRQPPPPYEQPHRGRKMKAVTKKRGLSANAHGGHLMATVFTCGLWLPFYGCWWLYRQFVRRRQVTKYRG